MFWAQHPYNQSETVPFHTAVPTSQIPVHLTSSRSLALTGALRGFTIKLATDHPHGRNGERQESKLKSNDDIDSALIHSNHLRTVNEEFGDDPKLVMLEEVLTIEENESGVGAVIRDARALDDGHSLRKPRIKNEVSRGDHCLC